MTQNTRRLDLIKLAFVAVPPPSTHAFCRGSPMAVSNCPLRTLAGEMGAARPVALTRRRLLHSNSAFRFDVSIKFSLLTSSRSYVRCFCAIDNFALDSAMPMDTAVGL
jgi:hypothetical protein